MCKFKLNFAQNRAFDRENYNFIDKTFLSPSGRGCLSGGGELNRPQERMLSWVIYKYNESGYNLRHFEKNTDIGQIFLKKILILSQYLTIAESLHIKIMSEVMVISSCPQNLIWRFQSKNGCLKVRIQIPGFETKVMALTGTWK